MAVDYGDARTGVAISDPDGILAGEAFVIKEWNTGRLAKKLNDIAKQRSLSGCGASRQYGRQPGAESGEKRGAVKILRNALGWTWYL